MSQVYNVLMYFYFFQKNYSFKKIIYSFKKLYIVSKKEL